MAYVPVNSVGQRGVIRDVEPHLLPLWIWNSVCNVRMNDGSVEKMGGHQAVFDSPAPTIAPWQLYYVPNPSQNYWVYAGLAAVHVWNGSTHTDITRRVTAPGACTAALAGAGAGNVDNGTHKWKVTFVNANGETEAGTESNEINVTDKSTDGKVDLSSIPTSSEDTVTARKIYRTEAGLTTFKLLTTISDNVTTTYQDNTADSGLGAAAPSTNDAAWDYVMDTGIGWNGGVLTGIPVLNNGVDPPQMWNPVQTTQALQDLTNWPANTTARLIRPFLNFLVALDVTKSGTRYPYLVKWSHPADPGAVPASWDETDGTRDTGEADLGETPDYLVDCLPLRNVNIVYKQQSAYVMQYVGGPFVFQFTPISKLDGMYAPSCAVEFRPGNHAVLTPDDFVVHNGVTSESVIDGQNRKWLFKSIDETNYEKTFVAYRRAFNEVWICFPTTGDTYCTQALVWNYRENTWGHRELPNITSMVPGVVPAVQTNDTWNSGAAVVWDSSGGFDAWDQGEASPLEFRGVMAGFADTKLYLVDSTYTFNGTAYLSYVERTEVPLAGLNRDGSTTLNFESVKFLRSVRPRFSVIPGDSMQLYVGWQMHIEDTVTWEGPFSMDPQNEFHVDVTVSGRLFSFRIEDASLTNLWKLDGFDIDVRVISLW